ncbi:MAG: aspartate/glutamate racemase family protein [Chloroflexi bacterium]|nr:aspartate/glutamate racemase family protein [Chloroflexota bacterium]
MTKRIKVVACTGEENTAKYQIPPEIISPGFTVDFETTRFPVWPDNYVDYRLVQLSILDVALSAEREGFDAVFVCDSTDLGLAEVRSALSIPVVGGGQATLQVGLALGRRLGIVTVWPRDVRFWYDDMLREYEMSDKLAGVRHITRFDELQTLGSDESWLKRMWNHQDDFLARVEEQCRLVIDEDGADVVMFGCTCMAAIRDAMQGRLEVPLLSPVHTGYQLTELLVRLGLRHSKKTFGQMGPVTRSMIHPMIEEAASRQTIMEFAPAGGD